MVNVCEDCGGPLAIMRRDIRTQVVEVYCQRCNLWVIESDLDRALVSDPAQEQVFRQFKAYRRQLNGQA